jgi:hypothetical protein
MTLQIAGQAESLQIDEVTRACVDAPATCGRLPLGQPLVPAPADLQTAVLPRFHPANKPTLGGGRTSEPEPDPPSFGWGWTPDQTRRLTAQQNAADLATGGALRSAIFDQAAANARFRRRVRITAPRPPKPITIKAHAAGSGIGVAMKPS